MSINPALLDILHDHLDNAIEVINVYQMIVDRWPQINQTTKFYQAQKPLLTLPTFRTEEIVRSCWDDKPGIRAVLWRKLGNWLHNEQVRQRGMFLRTKPTRVMRSETVNLDFHVGMFTHNGGVYQLDLGYSPTSDLLCYRWHVVEQEAAEHED